MLVVSSAPAIRTAPLPAFDSIAFDGDRLVMNVTFPDIGSSAMIREGGYDVISGSGKTNLYIPGKPLLPLRKYMIALPPGATARSVEVTRNGGVELPGSYNLRPAPCLHLMGGKADSNEDMREEWQRNYDSTYEVDTAYPDFEGKLSGSGTLRKYAYASVSICPFSYYPVSGRLKSYTSARITINYDMPVEDSPEARRIEETKMDCLADERAARLFLNFDQVRELYKPPVTLDQTARERYDYVILTDELLVNLVTSSEFYQWKKDTGSNPLVVLYTDPMITGQPGRDLAEQIRNFLRAYYLTWGVEHLLIVGDYETIPMRYCFPDPDDHNFNISDPYSYVGEVPTDYYYADLSLPDEESWDSDGDGFYGEYGQDTPDFLADIYVGRIPTKLSSRVYYTLNKLVSFGQDTGQWKNRALQPGAILFFENENYSGYPFCDGARLPYQIESDLMNSDWTISHYSEQSGLRTSDYDWPAISETAFTSDWRGGQYGVVNWAGHGGPNGVGRTIWQWDDGDGVPESNEYYSPLLISVDSNLDDDYPSIVFAVSCLVGYPEPNLYGNLGVDLLTKQYFGASAGVLSATRPAAISSDWPTDQGGAESLAYEFNRLMICGPGGSEMLGDALYDSKFYSHQNYGWDHIYEYLNLFDYNLYGDPSMLREGVATPVVDNSDVEFTTMSGSWLQGDFPDANEGNCVYNPAGSGDNSAAWRVDSIVGPGRYDVYVWKFDHSRSDLMGTDVHYKVRDMNTTSDWILVDQSTPGDEWIYLGGFDFDQSRAQGIMITDEADGYVTADAVKLVYKGSLP